MKFAIEGASGRRLDVGPAQQCVMGILNVTPDSFSDGGRYTSTDLALKTALGMVRDGAAILDLGAESTRPGALPVPADKEWERLRPVLEALRPATEALISIDTSKASVAERALALGADIINDVTALRGDPDLAAVAAAKSAPLILMHMRGEPRTMQKAPEYADTVSEVLDELGSSIDFAKTAGVAENRILLDPGIGFAKRDCDNRAILQNLDRFVSHGFPIVLGISRKSFLGRALTRPGEDAPPPIERDAATVAMTADAWAQGVSIHRVHHVRYAVDALRALDAFGRRERRAQSPSPPA